MRGVSGWRAGVGGQLAAIAERGGSVEKLDGGGVGGLQLAERGAAGERGKLGIGERDCARRWDGRVVAICQDECGRERL